MAWGPFDHYPISTTHKPLHPQTCTVAGATFPFMHQTNPSWDEDWIPDDPIPVHLKICTGPAEEWGTNNRMFGLPIPTVWKAPLQTDSGSDWPADILETMSMPPIPDDSKVKRSGPASVPASVPAETTGSASSWMGNKTTVLTVQTFTQPPKQTLETTFLTVTLYQSPNTNASVVSSGRLAPSYTVPTRPSPSIDFQEPLSGAASPVGYAIAGISVLTVVAACAILLL